MNHTVLIANDIQDYVNIVLKLVTDHVFQREQAENILDKFHYHLNQNQEAAKEWKIFFQNLMTL